jgi:hypothetical protein
MIKLQLGQSVSWLLAHLPDTRQRHYATNLLSIVFFCEDNKCDFMEQPVEKQQFMYHKVTSVRRMFGSHGGKCFWRDLTYFVQFCEHSESFLDIPF